VHVVNALPKTRSGKLLRRSLQALAEQRDPGDLSTLDDPGALEEIRRALGADRSCRPLAGTPSSEVAGQRPALPSTCAKLGLSSTCNTRRAPGNARAVGDGTQGACPQGTPAWRIEEGMQWHCCTPRRLLAVGKSKTVAGACRQHCVRSC
jgi:hypothetical protein